MEQATTSHTRMDRVQPPIVPVIGDIIRQVPGTISLGQGVVHYGPPRAALDAARAALDVPATHEYQDGAGLASLVDRIRTKLRLENGIDLEHGSGVMVTVGANLAFVHAVGAITEPGDEVILNVPFYFNHEMAIQMAGCTAVHVATDEHYQLRIDAIRQAMTPRTRAIVTISPNNPSGAVLTTSSLKAVNALCRDHGLYHISDEVYEYFTHGPARHASPGSFEHAGGHTISMFSLSKAYGFAGWRVGYMVYPGHLASAMMKSQDTLVVCPPVISQLAAIAALDAGRAYCDAYVRDLTTVRDLALDALADLGGLVEVPASDGAFYFLVKVITAMDPMTLAERLIREHRVAAIPGTAFGMTDGCSLRVAYGALQKETVAEGMGRLTRGIRALTKLEGRS